MSFNDDDFLNYSLNELTKTDSPPPGGHFYDPIDNIPLNDDPGGSPFRDYGELVSYNNDLSVPLGGDYQYGNDQMRSSPNSGYQNMHNMQSANSFDPHMQPSTSMTLEYNSFEMPTVVTTNGSQMDDFVDLGVLEQNNTYYSNQQPSTSEHQVDQNMHILSSDNQFGQQISQQPQLIQMQPSTSYGQSMEQQPMGSMIVGQQHQTQQQEQQQGQQQMPPPKPPPKKSKSSRKKQPPNTVGAVLTKVNKMSQQIGDGGSSSIETRMTAEDSARIGQLMNEMARLQTEQQTSGIDHSALLSKLQTEFSSIFAKNLSQSSTVNNTEIMTQIKSLTGEPQQQQQQQQQHQHIPAPQPPKRPPPKRNRNNQQKTSMVDSTTPTTMMAGQRYGAEPDSPGYQPQIVYQSGMSMQQQPQCDSMGNVPSTSTSQTYIDYQQQQPIMQQGQQQQQSQANLVPSMNSRTHVYRQQAVVYQSSNNTQMDGQSVNINSQRDVQYQSQQVYVQQQGQPILISRQQQNEQNRHIINTSPHPQQQTPTGRDYEAIPRHGTPQQHQLYDNASGAGGSPSMTINSADTPTLRQHLLAGGRLTPNSTMNSGSKAVRRVSSAKSNSLSHPPTPQQNTQAPTKSLPRKQLHKQTIVVSQENRHLFPELPIGMVFELVQNTGDQQNQMQGRNINNQQQKQLQQQPHQQCGEQGQIQDPQKRQMYSENVEQRQKLIGHLDLPMDQAPLMTGEESREIDSILRPLDDIKQNMNIEDELETPEQTAKLLENYEDLRSQRENAMTTFLQQQLDNVEFPDPFTEFKSKRDMVERLLPFHLLAEPEVSEEVFDDFDDNWCRHNINLQQVKKSLENRIKKVCLEDAFKHSYASERNLIMYLETEYERKKLKGEKELAAVNIEEFIGTSKIVSSFRDGSLNCGNNPPIEKPLHISTEWEDGQLSEYYKEYEYHEFIEEPFIPSPYQSPILSSRRRFESASSYSDLSTVSSPMKSPKFGIRSTALQQAFENTLVKGSISSLVLPAHTIERIEENENEEKIANVPSELPISSLNLDFMGKTTSPAHSSIPNEPEHLKPFAMTTPKELILPPPLPKKSTPLLSEPVSTKSVVRSDLLNNDNIPFSVASNPLLEKQSSSTANTFEDSDGSASPELGLDDLDDYYRPPVNNEKECTEGVVGKSEEAKKKLEEEEREKAKQEKRRMKEEKRRSTEEKRRSQDEKDKVYENGKIPIVSKFKLNCTPKETEPKPAISLRVPISVYKNNVRQEEGSIQRESEENMSHAPIKLRIKLPQPPISESLAHEPKKPELLKFLEVKPEVDDPEFNSIEMYQRNSSKAVEPIKAKIAKELKTDSPTKKSVCKTKDNTDSPRKQLLKTPDGKRDKVVQKRKRRLSDESDFTEKKRTPLLNGQRKEAHSDGRLARIVVDHDGSMKLRLSRLAPSVINLFSPRKASDSLLSPTASTRLKMTISTSGGACFIKFDESDKRIQIASKSTDTPRRVGDIKPVGVKNGPKAFVRMSDKSKLKMMSEEKKKKRREENSSNTSTSSSPVTVCKSLTKPLKTAETNQAIGSTKTIKQSSGLKNSKAFCNRFNPFASIPKTASGSPNMVNSLPIAASTPTVNKISALSALTSSSTPKARISQTEVLRPQIEMNEEKPSIKCPIPKPSNLPPPLPNSKAPSPNPKKKLSALLPWMTESDADQKQTKINSEAKPMTTDNPAIEVDIVVPKASENSEKSVQPGSPRTASSMSLTALFEDDKSNGGFPFLGSPPRTSEPLPAVEFSDDDNDSEMRHTDFSRATERIIAMSSNVSSTSINPSLPWQKSSDL